MIYCFYKSSGLSPGRFILNSFLFVCFSVSFVSLLVPLLLLAVCDLEV